MPLARKPFFFSFSFFFFFFLLKNVDILNFFKELKILNFIFFIFFWKIWKSWIFSRNWKFWLMIFFFWKQPKKYEPNARSPKAFFENFLLLFFFFLFFENFVFCLSFFFFFFWWNMKICSLSKSEEDEAGVKVLKIYSWRCFLKNLSFEWE